MRRKRMVPITALTDQLTRQNKDEDFRRGLLIRMPARVLGEAPARRITAVRVEGDRLILHVPDEAWRRELAGRKALLLHHARDILDHIRDVQFTA